MWSEIYISRVDCDTIPVCNRYSTGNIHVQRYLIIHLIIWDKKNDGGVVDGVADGMVDGVDSIDFVW